MNKSKKIIFAGAAPDTGNLGVSALLESMVSGVSDKNNQELVVFDHSVGLRKCIININGVDVDITLCGAKHGKRVYQFENFTNIRYSAKLGGGINPIAKCILSSNVMLDISGGDSFTDLYGEWRFQAITLPKLIAIENNIPLILMPQTYGPYLSSKAKTLAEKIVRGSTLAYARDEESFNLLVDLLGDEFDENRHIQGVDMAFLLKKASPLKMPSKRIQDWLQDVNVTNVGINVSGLIYNQIEKSYSQYGFKANYQDIIYQLIKKILNETDANIILIPHVMVSETHFESDFGAIKKVISLFSSQEQERMDLVLDHYDASEIKWIISQVDWFCGTRMHSTIAGLSTGVPTAAIAYSLKTWRVFKTCNQESQVIDPRELDTVDVVDGLWECWLHKKETSNLLEKSLPDIFVLAKKQMEMIRLKISTLK